MVSHPCMICQKAVPKRRRDRFVDEYGRVLPEGECCTASCWSKCLDDCRADAISEYRADMAAERGLEQLAELQSLIAHGE